jgi:two-component system KDP operon response regulator KdpE
VTTVLVIEDEPRTAEVLVELLRHLGYRSVSAATGSEGLRKAAETKPDLVVLDLGLPDLAGLEVIRELRSWSETPILVVSGSSQNRRKADALDAGADDFLDKPFDAGELRARLKAAERRMPTTPGRAPLLRRFGDLVVDQGHRQVFRGDDEVRLTDTEWTLLEALTRHPGRLLTHRWLVQHVWGPSAGAETQASLRTHLRALRAKIGDDARKPTYLRTESGIGYRWIRTLTAQGPEGPEQSSGPPSALGEFRAQTERLRVSLEALLDSPESGEVGASESARLRDLVEEVVAIGEGLGPEKLGSQGLGSEGLDSGGR